MATLIQKKKTGGHWYYPNGDPGHSILKADGSGERAVTIKDAKSLGLFPSVTTILSVMGKQGLDLWKQRQVAIHAMNDTAIAKWQAVKDKDDKTKNEWADDVINLANQQVSDAADLGTAIHDCLDRAIRGEQWDTEKYGTYVNPVLAWWKDKGLQVDALEIVLVNKAEGYAGRCDVLFRYGKAGIGILDYKTRKTKPGEVVQAYDGQGMQLAAYAAVHWGVENLDRVLAANIFISTTEPGRFDVVKNETLRDEYEAFKACCLIWRHLKKYDPRKAEGPGMSPMTASRVSQAQPEAFSSPN